MSAPRLPRLAEWLLHRLLADRELRSFVSELTELYEARVERIGARAARRWWRRQTMRMACGLAVDRVRSLRPGLPRSAAPLWGDVRIAVRSLARSPVLAAAIAMTFALGIGSSAAMFAVVEAVLLRPLPYDDAERVVRIHHAIGANRWSLSPADWEAVRDGQTRFTSVAASGTGMVTVVRDGAGERVWSRSVTPGWFHLLGVEPASGRDFAADDGRPEAPATVLLSASFWRDRLGSDPAAVGSELRIDGEPHTVIGVLPPEPGPLEERFQVFTALRLAPATRKGPFYLTVLGRLQDGVAPGEAAAELRAINERIFPLWQASWQDRSATYGLMPVAEVVAGRYRTPLLALLGAVCFVLLIGAANAANLLLARAAERRSELAVRAALGAGRGRLLGALLAESLVLCAVGVAVGLGLAAIATRAIVARPELLPRASSVTLADVRVVGFVVATTLFALLLSGLVPALQVLGGSLTSSGPEGRTLGGRRSAAVRKALVAMQFAIALPLLAGAMMLLQSFVHLRTVDPGFRAEGLVTAAISLPASDYPDAARIGAFWDRLAERLERSNLRFGVATERLLAAQGSNNFNLIDRPVPAGSAQPGAIWITATPGYFEAVGIALVRGRLFDDRDNSDTPDVVVDRTWADHFYPGEDPIGRSFHAGGCERADCAVFTVAGVVENVKYSGLEDALPDLVHGTIYASVRAWAPPDAWVFVRGPAAPAALTALAAAVRSLDPAVPVSDVATAPELVDGALAVPRGLAILVGIFAAIALALAALGIYGVMNYFVRTRRREIGLRMALGGGAGSVTRLVVSRGMRPVLIGLAVGALGAQVPARVLPGLLFRVEGSTFGPVLPGLAMLAAALLACYLPARRAARLEPLPALRE